MDARKALASRASAIATPSGFEPEFRAGLHAGVVIASEQGDLRRSIEFNGDHINIAARLEQKARDHDLPLVFSEEIAEGPTGSGFEPVNFGEETVNGTSEPIRLFKLELASG